MVFAKIQFALVIFVLVNLSHSYPQYYPTSPEKNWRSVILSRNGPGADTTTERENTTWPSTTYRSFGVEHIQGPGQGSVEETQVSKSNRPKDRFKTEPYTSHSTRNFEQRLEHTIIFPILLLFVAQIQNYFE